MAGACIVGAMAVAARVVAPVFSAGELRALL
jgi:hypothetical protein